jgi:hypothetical protein
MTDSEKYREGRGEIVLHMEIEKLLKFKTYKQL